MNLVILKQGKIPVFYVVDEAKYIKEWEINWKPEETTNGKVNEPKQFKLKVVNGFFVGQNFRGNKPFFVLNEMLFEGSTGYELKRRNEWNENNDNSVISGLP